jgi:hypothetical protein
MRFDVAGYNAGIREVQECEEVPGVRMCAGSFVECHCDTEGRGLRIKGRCNLCQQNVGAIVVRDGVVRVNWHERPPIVQKPAAGPPDNGIPDEVF